MSEEIDESNEPEMIDWTPMFPSWLEKHSLAYRDTNPESLRIWERDGAVWYDTTDYVNNPPTERTRALADAFIMCGMIESGVEEKLDKALDLIASAVVAGEEKQGRTAMEWFHSGEFPEGITEMSLTFSGRVRMFHADGSSEDYEKDEVIQ